MRGWTHGPSSSTYSPEVRERFAADAGAQPEHGSQWAAIAAIAPKAGCTTETLRRWVRQAERDAGQRAGLTTDERAELRRLQREVAELKRANEILKKASAYFARRSSTAAGSSGDVYLTTRQIQTQPHRPRGGVGKASRRHGAACGA